MSRKSNKHGTKRRDHISGVPARRKPASRKHTRAAACGICVLLFLAVFLVFGRSAAFEFVDFDDIGNVSENPFVRQGLAPSSILWAFTHSQVGDWIPLTTLSHMLD